VEKMASGIVRFLTIFYLIFNFAGCNRHNTDTGEPLWEIRYRFPVVYLQNLNEKLLGAKSIDRYFMIEKVSGKIQQDAPLAGYGQGGALFENDRIYYGGADYRFQCYDLQDDKFVWEFKSLSEIKSLPALDSQAVYWSSADSIVYAVDKLSGNLRWKFKTGCHMYATPVIIDSILLIGSWDTHLYALNKKEGSKIWEFAAQAGIDQRPIVVGQTAWLPSYDYHIYGIDLLNGRLKHDFVADNAFEFSGARWGDKLIFSGIDRHFYFIDLETDSITTKGISPVAISTAPLVSNNWLFTGQYDGALYIWRLPSMEKERLYQFDDRVLFLSTDEKYLWATSWDRTMVCWELEALDGLHGK
jgi:outer membrane protein assembly factor BamB